MWWKTILRHFSEKSKLSLSLDQWSKVLYSLYLLKLNCRSIAITSYKAFQKPKRRLELVSFPYFMYDFLRNMFPLLCSTN